MAEFSIQFLRSARKELEHLEESAARRVLRQIESLSDEPRPSGCRKLRGQENLWRIRIRDYRVVYRIEEE